jgi:hypothetical protein
MMALVIRFNTIVLRKTSIAAKYPGGLAHYRALYLPHYALVFYEDHHLIAHTAMGAFYEVEERLASHGLSCQGNGGAVDYHYAHQADGIGSGCPGLAARVIGGLPVCWLAAETPGYVVDLKNRRFVRWVSQAACDACRDCLGLAAAVMAVDAREWRDGPLAFVAANGEVSGRGYVVVCARCGAEGAFDEMGARVASPGSPA